MSFGKVLGPLRACWWNREMTVCPQGTGRLWWHCPGLHGAGRHSLRVAQHHVLAFLSPVHALSSSGEGLCSARKLTVQREGTAAPNPTAWLSSGQVGHPAARQQDDCLGACTLVPSYNTRAPARVLERKSRRWRRKQRGQEARVFPGHPLGERIFQNRLLCPRHPDNCQ